VSDTGERRETGRSPVLDAAGDLMFEGLPQGCGCLAETVSAGCMTMLILAAVPVVPLLLR
jgi:hypothetical protein